MTSLSTQSRAEESTGQAATWAPLAVILCGTFVYVLHFFIVNVALPSVQRDLGASPAAVEWVVAGYGLTSASFPVTGERLGDHYGRRRLFCVGIATFTVTSALCAAAPNAGFLIAARLAQGVGAAIMAPNVLSILGTTYTGSARVKAISIYGMVMGATAAVGQPLGGLLIAANVAGLGWRMIFWVNVPVGIAAVVLARRLVPESRATGADTTGQSGLDLRGAALLTTALVAILLPLLDGREQGWPAWSWASLAAGPVIAGVFAAYLRDARSRGRHPLLDPAIFTVRAFRAGVACQLLFYCQTAASYLLLALYLQEGCGLSPIQSGGVFAVLAAGFLATSLRAPGLTIRFGHRVVATGALVAGLGDVLLVLAVLPGAAGGPVTARGPCPARLRPLSRSVMRSAWPSAGSSSTACSTPATDTASPTGGARPRWAYC